MKSWARTRAAVKRGPNYKAVCSICGKKIANRMVYADRPEYKGTGKVDYAHISCSKTEATREWTPCW